MLYPVTKKFFIVVFASIFALNGMKDPDAQGLERAPKEIQELCNNTSNVIAEKYCHKLAEIFYCVQEINSPRRNPALDTYCVHVGAYNRRDLDSGLPIQGNYTFFIDQIAKQTQKSPESTFKAIKAAEQAFQNLADAHTLSQEATNTIPAYGKWSSEFKREFTEKYCNEYESLGEKEDNCRNIKRILKNLDDDLNRQHFYENLSFKTPPVAYQDLENSVQSVISKSTVSVPEQNLISSLVNILPTVVKAETKKNRDERVQEAAKRLYSARTRLQEVRKQQTEQATRKKIWPK